MRERLRLRQAEPLDRPRPLDGQQRVLVGRIPHLGAADLALLQPRIRRVTVARVDDEEIVVRIDPVGDQIVDDAAAVVRQQRVLRVALTELVEIVREQRLKQLVRVRALDVELAHVRDVEDAAVGAHRPVLRNDALVLDGHLPAGEGHHPRAGCDVASVERRLHQGLHEADSNDWRKHDAPASRGVGPGLLSRPGSRPRGHVRTIPRPRETQTSRSINPRAGRTESRALRRTALPAAAPEHRSARAARVEPRADGAAGGDRSRWRSRSPGPRRRASRR